MPYLYYLKWKLKFSVKTINKYRLISYVLYCITAVTFFASCDKSKPTGLFHDSFNNSIELKSDGTVHYNQLVGNSPSCHTTGYWRKIDNNRLRINLDITSNCSFVGRYSGIWEIKNCFKYGESKSGCLVMGDQHYFFKKN